MYLSFSLSFSLCAMLNLIISLFWHGRFLFSAFRDQFYVERTFVFVNNSNLPILPPTFNWPLVFVSHSTELVSFFFFVFYAVRIYFGPHTNKALSLVCTQILRMFRATTHPQWQRDWFEATRKCKMSEKM